MANNEQCMRVERRISIVRADVNLGACGVEAGEASNGASNVNVEH